MLNATCSQTDIVKSAVDTGHLCGAILSHKNLLNTFYYVATNHPMWLYPATE